jgi:hypothetical protein
VLETAPPAAFLGKFFDGGGQASRSRPLLPVKYIDQPFLYRSDINVDRGH